MSSMFAALRWVRFRARKRIVNHAVALFSLVRGAGGLRPFPRVFTVYFNVSENDVDVESKGNRGFRFPGTGPAAAASAFYL